MEKLLNRYISVNSSVCHGRPRFKGTRIPITVALELLESGMPIKDILRGYPSLNEKAIKAAIHYAIARIREEDFIPVA